MMMFRISVLDLSVAVGDIVPDDEDKVGVVSMPGLSDVGPESSLSASSMCSTNADGAENECCSFLSASSESDRLSDISFRSPTISPVAANIHHCYVVRSTKCRVIGIWNVHAHAVSMAAEIARAQHRMFLFFHRVARQGIYCLKKTSQLWQAVVSTKID